MDFEEEINRYHGFDRGINYNEIKQKLISQIKKEYKSFLQSKKRIVLRKIIYLIVCMIQLRNASRVSESVRAFYYFIKHGIDDLAKNIKISKSDAIKTNKEGKKRKSKPRFRNMIFPRSWIPIEIFHIVQKKRETQRMFNCDRFKKRILDYLLNNFNCNTHSLRYACINYLLYDKGRPVNDVATFCGHSNCQQILNYTQRHRVNEIYDIDM